MAGLRAQGVDRVFCVAGESYLPILDRLYDTAEIEVVTCRHEASAAFAAVADAKLTGHAGVCLVSRAPGATNAAIAAHSAAEDATPLVLIVGDVSTDERGRDSFQEIDCGQLFGGFTKGVWQLAHPPAAAEFLGRAFRVAESGTPGPVVLTVPEDVLYQRDPGPMSLTPVLAASATVRSADLAAVASTVRRARRPLLVAGGLLGSAKARATLRETSERLLLPILTSNKHQDLFDNRHPHYAGHLHNNTQAGQRALFERADVVLAVGTRLDATTTLGHRFPSGSVPDQALIHVYPDPARLGARHRPAIALAADPGTFLGSLAQTDPPTDPARVDWIDELHAFEVEKGRWQQHQADDGVPFGAVITALDDVTGGDIVVTVDSGTFTSWLYRYLRLTGNARMLGVTSSAMGFGVPAAVAAAMRLRRPVVAVVGDGGFLMTGSELATAVAHDLPLIVLIANNASYGTIRLHQERTYPGRVIATDLRNPDFARLAEAYGCLGLSIAEEADVAPVLRRAMGHGGPVVVDVRTSLQWITAYRRLALTQPLVAATSPRSL
ncbi:acetolactate synthase-1/2/3 large subunit [Asanoa hainanensis]|uniref:Acetolactate synthase-1/2/3 large subunit n=1 Tax=Asanoa hainanensis TaxID=560556 RepID=A0A239P3R0_9ACTN|nr:acetolactate synthase-1/2/3 large subunit [Asanoa hainanensis]